MNVAQRSCIRFPLVIYLSLALCLIGAIPTPAAAMWLSPESPGSARRADLDRIRTVLENRLVAQRLSDLGLSATQVSERMSDLSDEEVHQIATRLDALTPGGDTALGVIIALLVIAILVIVVIQLSGHKVVITK